MESFHSRLVAQVCVAFFGVSTLQDCRAQGSVPPPLIVQDRCAQQLRVLRQAIYAFEKANQAYPETLDALVPDYLGSSDFFICPEAKKFGDTTSGSVRVRDYSGVGASYEYQLVLKSWPVTDLQGMSQDTTIREFKLNQAKALGDEVPCIRCFHHGADAVRNMSLGGRIYVTGQYWESAFVDEIAFPYLMDGVMTDQRPVWERLPQRDKELPDTSLDLSASYNALLTDRWLGGGTVLERGSIEPGVMASGEIRFDVRGVVQLQGEGFSLVKFPSRRSIKVGRSCKRVHVLHGSFFKGKHREKVASYRLQFAHGESKDIPVKFGDEIWHSEVPAKTERPRELAAIVQGSPTFTVYHASFEVLGGQELSSIEFISAMSEVAPFLLGVTVE